MQIYQTPGRLATSTPTNQTAFIPQQGMPDSTLIQDIDIKSWTIQPYISLQVFTSHLEAPKMFATPMSCCPFHPWDWYIYLHLRSWFSDKLDGCTGLTNWINISESHCEQCFLHQGCWLQEIFESSVIFPTKKVVYTTKRFTCQIFKSTDWYTLLQIKNIPPICCHRWSRRYIFQLAHHFRYQFVEFPGILYPLWWKIRDRYDFS